MSLSFAARASARGILYQLARQSINNNNNNNNLQNENEKKANVEEENEQEANDQDEHEQEENDEDNSEHSIAYSDNSSISDDDVLINVDNNKSFIDDILNRITCSEVDKKIKALRVDDYIFEHSDITNTILVESLGNFICNNALTDYAGVEITELINRILPNNKQIKLDYTINGTKKPSLAHLTTGIFWYECCSCFRTVYTNQFSELTECPECKVCRYKNIHSYHRVAVQLISYRSFIYTIKELLSTENFIRAINYLQVDSKYKSLYGDVKNGRVYKQHSDEMKRNYNNKYTGNDRVIEISLLLAVYYDGVQLFGNKVVTFWPLLVSILNLPPNLRKLFGAGIFLVSVLTTKINSTHEDFIIKERFICELLALKDGIEILIGNTKYFIQARLILHCYDTKAMEQILDVQATNSLSDCPLCNTVKGWGKSDYLLGALCYIDHRKLLPLKHILRSYGQSKHCCEKNFYNDKKVRDKSILNIYSFNERNQMPNLVENKSEMKNLNPCDTENSRDIINFLIGPEMFTWFHRSHPHFYDPTIFKGYLYYMHCDYRPYTAFTRVSNQSYLLSGRQAIQEKKPVNGIKGIWLYAALEYSDVARMINSDPFHVLYGIAKNLLSILKGKRATDPTIRSFCYLTDCHPCLWSSDTFVKTKDAGKLLAGEKKQRTPILTKEPTIIEQPSKKQKIQPPATNSSVQTLEKSPADYLRDYCSKCPTPAWVLSKATQEIIDKVYLTSIRISTGFKRDFSVVNVFTQTGKLNGAPMLCLFDSMIDYITYCIEKCDKNYPEPYLQYLRMVSNLMSNIMSPLVSDDYITELYNQTVEVVSLQHGLFPLSESISMYHQLIHLPHFIREFGPIRGWWTLPSERSLSEFKTRLVKGGVSSYIALMRKQYQKNFSKLHQVYSDSNKSFPTDEGKYEVVNNDQLSFSDFRCNLITKLNKRLVSIQLTTYERQQLLLFLVKEVELLCPDKSIRLQESPLYRLYLTFQVYRETNKNKFNSYAFYDWLILHKMREEYLRNADQVLDLNDIIKDSILVNIQNGYHFSCDFLFMTRLMYILLQAITIYSKAYIWGRRFSGRGSEYSEKKPCDEVYAQYGAQERIRVPSNDKNVLRKYAFDKSSYSSWCKLQQYIEIEHIKDIYGQLNYFFSISLPEDRILNGLLVASITSRKAREIHNNLYEISIEEPIYSDVIFSTLYNIYPSQVASIIFNDSAVPYPVPVKNNNNLQNLLGISSNISIKLYNISNSHDMILRNKSIREKIHPYYKALG